MRAVIDYQADVVIESQGDYLDHLDTLEGLKEWRDFVVDHQRRLQGRGGCPIGSRGEVAETDPSARLAAARGFRRWEARIPAGFRTMQNRGDLPADVDPEDLALATLAALQGGLRLTQIQRETRPLEVALDAILERIRTLSESVRANT